LGDTKATLGTGCFVNINVGKSGPYSSGLEKKKKERKKEIRRNKKKFKNN